jgi:hypothetical protein
VVFPFEEELSEGAGDRQIYERSGGRTRPLLPPSVGYRPQLDEVSADATHVFITTDLSLAPEDTDGPGGDIYDISAGRATLVSTGPLAGGAGPFFSFMGASPDGGRVFFDSFAPLTPDDLDACPDLYQRSAGQTTLVGPNPSPPPPPICESARFGGVSGDASHLFFVSAVKLEPGDERGDDIYQQVGTSLTRLTTYPEPSGECVDAVKFADASADGGTVLFSTNAQIVTEDTDSTVDVYKRRGDGTFSLVSRGTDGGIQPCGFGGDRPVALSADGSTAIFETTARLSPADTDSSNDLYSAPDGGAIELVSTGPTDANVDERSIVFPDWLALVSDDAKRVVFETKQALVPADEDSKVDVYLRVEGRTELVSAAASGKVARGSAELLAFSADGSTVVFATNARLSKADADRDRDVYVWRADRPLPRLISGETIAPLMRIGGRGLRLRPGVVAVRLACPKVEASTPCHGRLVLEAGGRGPLFGAGRFRISPGQRARVRVRLRPRYRESVPDLVLARARGADALGNTRVAVRRVRIAPAPRG